MARSFTLFARSDGARACARRVVIEAVAGMCALATAANAAAQAVQSEASDAVLGLTRPASTIEIGAGFGSGEASGAGSPDGALRKGASAIGRFDLRGSQYSFDNPEDDRTRWRLGGSRLGLRAHSLTGEYGRQGIYRVTVDYSASRHLVSDSYQTPLLGAGSADLGLPAGFVRGASTGAMATLDASMRRFDVEAVRRRLGVDVRYWLDTEWELRLRLHNDALDGSRLRGAEFGSNGGNARSMLLAEPLDSATQQVEASVAFSGEGRRFVLAYHGSMFRNHIDSVTWQNPYANAAWVGGGSGLPAGFALDSGRIGVAPDNDLHQVSLNGSYDFSRTTRLTLSASRGRMTQNAPFLPYTVNPGLVSTGLPRASLDGRVETRFLLARLAMRPVRALSLVAALRYDDRDNRTPQSEFIYVGGDIQLQPQAGSDSDRIRTNLARSRRLLQLSLDADYRLPGARVVRLGWEREGVRRTFAEVERTAENTYRAELRQGGTGPWTATVGYARQVRRGSDYLYNLPFLASYSSAAFVGGLAAATGCTDLLACVRAGALQQKFFIADRDRDRARLSLGYTPDGRFSMQARLEAHRDAYPHSAYGVVDAAGWSAGADIAYALDDDVNATVFYGLDDQRTRERGRQVAGRAPAGDSRSDWMNRFADRTASLGVGLRYTRLLGGRLELDLDAIAVRGRTPVSTTVGPAVTAAQNPAGPLPDLRYRSDTINLVARYALDRSSTVKVQYLVRRASQDDWAYQEVGFATLANLVGTGQTPVRRTVHGLGVTYILRLR